MFNLRLNGVSSFFLSPLFLFFVVIVTFPLDDGYLIYADLSKRWRWKRLDEKLLDPEASILNFLTIRLNVLLFSLRSYCIRPLFEDDVVWLVFASKASLIGDNWKAEKRSGNEGFHLGGEERRM